MAGFVAVSVLGTLAVAAGLALLAGGFAHGWAPVVAGVAFAASWPPTRSAWRELTGRELGSYLGVPGWVWAGAIGVVLTGAVTAG